MKAIFFAVVTLQCKGKRNQLGVVARKDVYVTLGSQRSIPQDVPVTGRYWPAMME